MTGNMPRDSIPSHLAAQGTMTRRQAIKTALLGGTALVAMPAALAQTNSSTPAPSPPDLLKLTEPELARQILGDPTLSRVHGMAQDLLKSGLNAGSSYIQVWIRDLNTFIEVALQINPPERFREALLTFFKFQGPRGEIVDGYLPLNPAKVNSDHRTSPLAPGLMAFKNTVETDQESSLVQALSKYVAITGDQSILEERIAGVSVRERLGLAMQHLLKDRFDRKHGLVWGGTRADWGDVQPEDSPGVRLDAASHRALCIYDNAMLVAAINDFIQLPGQSAHMVRHWTSVRKKLSRNVRKTLWDEKNDKFIPHVYLAGSPFPKSFDENAIYYHGGTAVAIEAGLLDRDEAGRALDRMVADVRGAGAGSIGLTMYPPYPQGFFKNPQLRAPYTYQNGGDWCWFGGRMIQQMVKLGYVAGAYRQLLPMVERVPRAGGFHEWWSRTNRPRGSGNFRGSAGVLGRSIELLQAWAHEHS